MQRVKSDVQRFPSLQVSSQASSPRPARRLSSTSAKTAASSLAAESALNVQKAPLSGCRWQTGPKVAKLAKLAALRRARDAPRRQSAATHWPPWAQEEARQAARWAVFSLRIITGADYHHGDRGSASSWPRGRSRKRASERALTLCDLLWVQWRQLSGAKIKAARRLCLGGQNLAPRKRRNAAWPEKWRPTGSETGGQTASKPETVSAAVDWRNASAH